MSAFADAGAIIVSCTKFKICVRDANRRNSAGVFFWVALLGHVVKVQVSVSAENILVGRAQNDRRDDESLDTESREKFRRKIGKRAERTRTVRAPLCTEVVPGFRACG